MEQELNDGNVTEAIILVNANGTETNWFQYLYDGVLCFTDHRIDYTGEGSGSTHGSCFVYFGPNRRQFAKTFKQFGNVVRRF